LSDFLAGAGVLVAALASGAAVLLPPGRPRAVAMALAMALVPVLIVGDQWHTVQIVDLRHDEERVAALVLGGVAGVSALTYAFRRWRTLFPLAFVFALPFRVPLHAGGDTANLLVPLYLVIAAGVVAEAIRDWRGAPAGESGRLPARVLAAVVVLYALQTLYSADFSKGLQNVCFFLVPFTVAYRLLRDVEWDARMLRLVLVLIGVEATAFVLVGSVEYGLRELFWNDQIIRSNEFHVYFRVNSVFWDPNVYGRYLALVIVMAAAALLWVRGRRDFLVLTALIALLWVGLVQTFSESSSLALLAGLALLAALRWSWRRTLVAVGVALLAILGVVAVSGKLRLNTLTSGRANLVSGGLDLWTERPIWGYGSGAFQAAYRDHRENKDAPVTVSHTEPVTVLAEQGLIGFALYVVLILVALRTLGAAMWGGQGSRAPPAAYVGRAAVLAAFVALLVHTLAYAGFFEDPITWLLLAVGTSLALGPAVAATAERPAPVRAPA
jgi:O-antigen ligase